MSKEVLLEKLFLKQARCFLIFIPKILRTMKFIHNEGYIFAHGLKLQILSGMFGDPIFHEKEVMW